MISIIICSRSQYNLVAIQQNVAATIGVPYEIVAIDNSDGQYGICQAYNLGAQQSRYDILCFMHEDICFDTLNWGQIVCRSFLNNPKLGLLGIAGSSYKALVPSGWSYMYASKGSTYINLTQHFKSTGEKRLINLNPTNNLLCQVVAIDGVWMCTTREVVNLIKFDDDTFHGFHCYDIDFSLSIFQKYEVAVTYELNIQHFSEGSFNESWLTETLRLHNKWCTKLPIDLADLSISQQAREESGAFHTILPMVIGKPRLCVALLRYIWKSKLWKIVGLKKFSIMSLLLIKKSTNN